MQRFWWAPLLTLCLVRESLSYGTPLVGPRFQGPGGLKAYGAGEVGPPPIAQPPQDAPPSFSEYCAQQVAKSAQNPQRDVFIKSRPAVGTPPLGVAPPPANIVGPAASSGDTLPAVKAVSLVSPGMTGVGRFQNDPRNMPHNTLPVDAATQGPKQQNDLDALYKYSDISISLPPLNAGIEVPGGQASLRRGDSVTVTLSNGARSTGQYIGTLEGQFQSTQGAKINGVYVDVPQFHGQIIAPMDRVGFTRNGVAYQPELQNPLPTVALQEGTLCATNQLYNASLMMQLRHIQNGLTRQLRGLDPNDNQDFYNYLRQVASSPQVMQSIDDQIGSQQKALGQAGISSYRTHDIVRALDHVEKGDIFGMHGLLMFDFPSAESVPIGHNRKRTSYDQRDQADRTIILESDRTRIEADMTYLPMDLRKHDPNNPADKRTFNGHAVLVADAFQDLTGRTTYVVLDSNKSVPRNFYREDFIREYGTNQAADYVLINPRPELVLRPEVPQFGGSKAPVKSNIVLPEQLRQRQDLQALIGRYSDALRKNPSAAPRILAEGLLPIVQQQMALSGANCAK
jgi:hypothetical protein